MKQNKMKILTLKIFVIFSGILFLMPLKTWATPSAQAFYLETNLGGGLWKYDYTLFNTSDPIADAGVDLYDLFVSFDFSSKFIGLSLPGGWIEVSSGPGFTEVASQYPGEPPAGADIPPGSSLSGFSFKINYQAGNLPFDATFTNSNDPSNPFTYCNGTTAPGTDPIPEPATILLIGNGLAGLGYLKGRRFF